MFRKYFGIQLDNPCSENWDNMTPSESGRFCNSCSKQVVDFTAMSDAAIVAYFKKHKNVCGRFAEEQLERNLLPYNRKQTLLGKAIAAVMLLFQTFIAGAQTDNAIPKAVIEQKAQSKQNFESECSKMIPGDSGAYKIKILVIDSNSFEPIKNARVLINGDMVECQTNLEGWIVIELPTAMKDSTVKLTVIKEGYHIHVLEKLPDTQVFAVPLLRKSSPKMHFGGASSRTINTSSHSRIDIQRHFPGLFRDF